MDARKIVVVVEDVEVARTALQWALHNILRFGDLVTLLHVYTTTASKSKKKLRLLRLKGFQLALSFRDICNSFPNTKTEIVVTEGDREGRRIASMVREIGASTLVVGLHDRSFLYRLVMSQNSIAFNLNCKVLAIKQPTPLTARTISLQDSSINMDFSQIEIATLSVPEVPPPKIQYQICPDPSAIIWRSGQSRQKRTS
ncbi:Adenine nucleotide alpha hydrolase-like superfamily protein [Forsythia ovata]|uniref:Adenine nucleotide alpha hydrolase-like superfamily protein n=1 Tax=Forsythia ovata TaxID=205694 RepID=A0ABD1R0K9_9LAMI